MDLLKNLNLNQKLAVMHGKGPQLVLGGAGTGKTLVVTNRIAYLIRERNILPENILAVTSTDIAAKRMSEQLQNILGDGEVPLITTFQALCISILRRDIHHLGFKSNFTIYDEADSKLLLKDVIEQQNIDENKYPTKAFAVAICECKNVGNSPDDLANSDQMADRLVRVYSSYQERLKKCNALDYGDLAIQSVRLLTDFPDVCRYYKERFHWIMIDNYEDITPVQFQLISLLVGERKNLCVAGDDDQSIFRQRGADLRKILDFERDFPSAVVIKLEQNFRSTSTILAAADAVVAWNRGRKRKTLWTENPAGEKIRYMRVEKDLGEARFVCQETARWIRKGGMLRDIAVFYRTNVQSRSVEDALVAEGIPYHMVGGMRFYERMEIKDILAYLKVIDNPADELSIKRIINVPPRGIGHSTTDRIGELAASQGMVYYDALRAAADSALLSTGSKSKVASFVHLIDEMRGQAASLPLAELAAKIINDTGYSDKLKEERTAEAADRLANLEELLVAMEEFARGEADAGLSQFLEQVALVSDLEKNDAGRASITLMTLHSAKGLEFPLVFMVGMEEKLFPHVRSLEDPKQMEEERRLCYVGMTRASERLYLLNAIRRYPFDEEQYEYQYDQEYSNLPSRFLKDIPPELLSVEEALVTEEYLNRQALPSDHDGDGSFFGFSVGVRVRHAKFGVGTIRKIEGSDETAKAIVWFSSEGPKKLLLRFAGLVLVDDVKNVPSVIPEPITYPCPACKTPNRIGSRLNYLYFRRSIKSASEIISALSDEQLFLRVHGKSITENPFFVLMVRQIRQSAGNDNLMLLKCLDGRPLPPSEIDEKRKEGFISKAEQRLFHMLKALADTNWSIYHQVDVGGLLNPVDIVAVTANFQIYAIELDGPHHLLSSQRLNDDQRDTLLLNQGFNIIRVGYEKYALSCAQAAQEILLVLRGQVMPENTWRPDVRVDIDESDSALGNKHPDFYRNRPQTDPSSNCEPPVGIPRRYCYIYCQSTGISEKSQIVDFCLLVEEGEVRKQFYSKIKPSCPIESKATALHGISDNDVNDCPSLHSYLEQHALKKILEDGDSLVVTYDWDFMGRVIKNTALRYFNWQNINLYNVVETVRLKHGLKPISSLSEAVATLNISPDKYKRYDSKEYVRLVREMFLVVTSCDRI